MSLNNRDNFPPAADGFFVALPYGGSRFIRDHKAEERRREWFKRDRLHRFARVLGMIPRAHIERFAFTDPPVSKIVRVEDGPVLWCRCCQRGSS